jgi:menaquinone-specific isochorismate synthase
MTTLPSLRPAEGLADPEALFVSTFSLDMEAAQALRERFRRTDAHVWTRDGAGLYGLGAAARATAAGRQRFMLLQEWFARLARVSTVTDPLLRPGSGLMAYGSFAFSWTSSVPSRLVVPQALLGISADAAWLTIASREPLVGGLAAALDVLDVISTLPRGVDLPDSSSPVHDVVDGNVDEARFLAAVAGGVERIEAGEVQKLVLGRDLRVRFDGHAPVAHAVGSLAAQYTDCWTYSLEGLFGATPEMLIQVLDGTARARVLAGTLDREEARVLGDEAAKAAFLADPKQRHEHDFAIRSLTQTLGPLVSGLNAPEEPFVLELPNVWHLASDVHAGIAPRVDGSRPGALDLVDVVHPTAAVCGTPRERAGDLIRELEGTDRGRFAGPVGWVDAHGNGEFGIALRGGVVEPCMGADGIHDAVRVWAGCGIVDASVPETELRETDAKMRPMLGALGALLRRDAADAEHTPSGLDAQQL